MTVSVKDSPAVVLGEKLATSISDELGITTIGELIRYMPTRYVRQGSVSRYDRPEPGDWVTLVAMVESANLRSMKNRRGKLLAVKASDGIVSFSVTFFNPYAIARALTPGVRMMVAGKVSYFRNEMQLTHPEWMVLPDDGGSPVDTVGSTMLSTLARGPSGADNSGSSGFDNGESDWDVSDFTRTFLPIYRATKNLQTWTIWIAIRRVLEAVQADIVEPLTPEQLRERGYIDTATALHQVHVPQSQAEIDAAAERLKFDEAFALQIALAQRRCSDSGQRAPQCAHVPGKLEDRLLESLPFTLTAGQTEVAAEVGDDLALGEPMSRLLQGEVGSGKTLVALLAMLRVIDNGFQCVLLAPTEVLAAQHHRTLSTMLGSLGSAGELGSDPDATRVALLTGSLRTAARRESMLDAVTGSAGVVIGTHAVLEERVEFFNLGMVVVDEQHRFGVEQRDVLRSRGRDGLIPHMLVMTATPIPRTVAMTVYGDLATSTLRELPSGRRPITTNIVLQNKPAWEHRLWQVVGEEIEAGHQIYVVCSRIGDDESATAPESQNPGQLPTASAIEMFAQLSESELGRFRIGLLHGRLSADEKADTMDAFTRGEIDIIVSTTVIEVGVDVANATVMVIVDAQRFGVSQLHQLRGRVGRGGLPGKCFLRTALSPQSPAMDRLRSVEASNDGFELARVDLMTRREGDVLGAAQSGGSLSLRYLSLVDDDDVIADARDVATEIVRDDISLTRHPGAAAVSDALLGASRASYLEMS